MYFHRCPFLHKPPPKSCDLVDGEVHVRLGLLQLLLRLTMASHFYRRNSFLRELTLLTLVGYDTALVGILLIRKVPIFAGHSERASFNCINLEWLGSVSAMSSIVCFHPAVFCFVFFPSIIG